MNTALIPAEDVVIPVLVVLALTCLFWAGLTVVLRNASRAALGSSVAILLVFAYGHTWDLISKNRPLYFFFDRNIDTFFWYWLSIFVASITIACWKRKTSEVLTFRLNWVSVFLVGVPVISILISWITAATGPKAVRTASRSAQLHVTSRPDIYYVILDGYGRNDSLKRVIGYDDDWFIKGLSDRGFFVAKDSRSNYCQTELSLSSSLNLEYLQTLLPNVSPTQDDRKVFDRLIDRNAVSKYLRNLGYRYEAITTGFPAVHPQSADLWLTEARGISLFAGVLLSEVPMQQKGRFVESQFAERREVLKDAIRNLEKSAVGGNQPRFIFAHILAPHPPFVFGPNGEPRRTRSMGYGFVDASDFMSFGGTPAEYAQGYREQATYLSKLMLAAVDEILRSAQQRPIIILQGDHGSKMRMDQQILAKTDVNECFPNLNAYLVPDAVRPNLYDGITPVNSFRMIFNGLFGDKFEKLPDRSYYSGWLTPFQFVDVTSRVKPSGP